MPIDPSIITSGNQMPQIRLPDVNAMTQTRMAGMENIYQMEQARAAQAQAAQKEQEAAVVEALTPAYATAYKGGGTKEALTAAVSLLPPEMQAKIAPTVEKLMALPSDDLRLSALETSLANGGAAGRAILDRIPTEIQRMNAEVQRGQLDIARQKLALEQQQLAQGPAGEYATVDTDQGIFIINKKTGEIRPATAESIPGPRAEGPIDVAQPPNILQSPTKSKETAEEVKKRLLEEKRAKDVAFAVKEVENAAASGGLIDKATGSYIGNMVDTAAQTFGFGTSGAIANAQMKPVADLVLKLVPRFEGPQSDKDTQSYKDAAGDLANPNLPSSVKKAAADQIVSLLKKYEGQFEYSGGGSGAGAIIDFNDLGD